MMKAYYDAGLKSLASTAGHSPPQLVKIQYQHTLSLLSALTISYWKFGKQSISLILSQFASSQDLSSDTSMQGLVEEISSNLHSIPHDNFSITFNDHVQSLAEPIAEHYDKFKKFIQTQAQKDDTWRFWVQFAFQDVMAYIGLYLSIRSGDWELRMGSMKCMAPVFTAFDHSIYQKVALIVIHM